MLKEIYHKTPDDKNYQKDIIDHSNVLEAYLQKIKMILNTSKGEILSYPEFGASLEDLIFDISYDGNEIKKRIIQQIILFCPESEYFDTEVEVNFFKGTTRDSALVDIIINKNKYFGILVK